MEKQNYPGFVERFASGDILRHFKRDLVGCQGTDYLYAYVGLARQTETGEPLAVYRGLYGERVLYARPAAMFFSPVDKAKYPDAKQQYGFDKAVPEDLQALKEAETAPLKPAAVQELEGLLARHPEFAPCREALFQAATLMAVAFRRGGKLLCCGNGGSDADCRHIAGELLKSFKIRRKETAAFEEKAKALAPEDADFLACSLEPALPCISLGAENAFFTAFANDAHADLAFAQQVHALGRPGDVLLGISTSGNSKNILFAVQTAKADGLSTILLSGRTGGAIRDFADCSILVPEDEVYLIQELHLPVYHALCAALEADFFEGDPK